MIGNVYQLLADVSLLKVISVKQKCVLLDGGDYSEPYFNKCGLLVIIAPLDIKTAGLEHRDKLTALFFCDTAYRYRCYAVNRKHNDDIYTAARARAAKGLPLFGYACMSLDTFETVWISKTDLRFMKRIK